MKLGILLSTMIAVASSFAPAHAQDYKKAAAELRNRYEQAFNKADAAGVASLYAKDAIIMPPDAGRVEGRSAIESEFKGRLFGKMKASNLKISSEETRQVGDLVLDTGAFTMSIQGAGGETQARGDYMTLVEKDEITRHIWNLDTLKGPPK